MSLFSGIQGAGGAQAGGAQAYNENVLKAGGYMTPAGWVTVDQSRGVAAPPPTNDHWSYYGATPLEAAANRAAGRGPMSQAEWDAAQNARNAAAAAAAPAPAAPSTSPFVIGGVPTGTPNMAAVNPSYMQAQPAMQPTQATPPATPQAPTQNPYLPAMADDITRRASTQFMQQINPAINRAAVANGGYGGSRQGIAQGLAMSQGMDNIAGQLSWLYANQFNADRNYGLANDALDLNVYNANQNWMRQGQQDQLGLADRLLGWNQQYGVGNATQVQNTPLNYWQQFSNTGAQLGGMGGTQSQNLQGNPYLGALGGAMTGAKLWNAWGG